MEEISSDNETNAATIGQNESDTVPQPVEITTRESTADDADNEVDDIIPTDDSSSELLDSELEEYINMYNIEALFQHADEKTNKCYSVSLLSICHKNK